MLPHTNVDKLILERPSERYICYMTSMFQSAIDLPAYPDMFLHPVELKNLAKMGALRERLCYISGRYTAKVSIAGYTGHQVLTDMLIYSGGFEQPIVHLPFPSNLQVSISHSDSLTMSIAFPESYPMGIDIEELCDEKIAVVREIMTPCEERILALMEGGLVNNMLIIWTVKEALSKVMRTGLMTPLSLYEISGFEHFENISIGSFRNFPQYKSLSWIYENHACSLVLPRKSMADLEFLNGLRLSRPYRQKLFC